MKLRLASRVWGATASTEKEICHRILSLVTYDTTYTGGSQNGAFVGTKLPSCAELPSPSFFFFFLCDCVIADTFLISPYDFFNNWLPIQ